MKNKKIISKFKTTFVIISVILTFSFTIFDDGDDFELIKNLEIYHSIFKELRVSYVNKIDVDELITISIEEMLETLDPYTVYYPESQIEKLRFFTNAEYAGIGVSINKIDSFFVITDIIKDGPSDHAGLLIGDIIIKVENVEIKDKTMKEISNLIKGEAEKDVKLNIKRENLEKPFITEIKRKNIKLKTIPYFGIYKEGIGYIKLDRFTRSSSNDVKNALIELKNNHNITAIILDLRNNPGGLLSEAVNIVNLFVAKDKLIVQMKGKSEKMNKSFFTKNKAVDTEIPLVILVNNNSASASEIVAGAIQDYDRGIIIGQNTYGKGLVQATRDLKYNAKLKITTAKYYIPSGRCIQAIDYVTDENTKNIPDSLLIEFETSNGRIVYEGKGIKPDIVVKKTEKQGFVKALISNDIIFGFATKYRLEHDSIFEKPNEYSFNFYEKFCEYVVNNKFYYKTKTEKAFEELLQNAEKENYSEEAISKIKSLKPTLKININEKLKINEKEITLTLEKEIIRRYYYSEGEILFSLFKDKEIKSAYEILKNKDDYNSLLKQ